MFAGRVAELEKVVGDLAAKYKAETPEKVKLMDLFLVFSAAAALILIVYAGLVGSFPFNAFLSAMFACAGLFVLTGESRLAPWVGERDSNGEDAVSLRLQLTNSAKFDGMIPQTAFVAFAACNIILFFVVFTFMG